MSKKNTKKLEEALRKLPLRNKLFSKKDLTTLIEGITKKVGELAKEGQS